MRLEMLAPFRHPGAERRISERGVPTPGFLVVLEDYGEYSDFARMTAGYRPSSCPTENALPEDLPNAI